MNPLTPVPNVVDAFAKAGQDGWITQEQGHELMRRLGPHALRGFTDIAINELKKPVLLTAAAWNAPPGAISSRTLLLLPDAAQVKRRVDGYLNALVDTLAAQLSTPGGEQEGDRILAAIRSRLPGILGVADLAAVLDAVERAAAGSLAALAKLIGLAGVDRWQPWDFSGYAPATFAGPGRPSASVITQAQVVYRLIAQGASARVGPVTGVLTQGLTGASVIPGVAGMGSDEERRQFDWTLGWLRELNMARVPYGILVDLAHLIVLAHAGNCQPKIVTGDWSVIEAFAAVSRVPLYGRGPTEAFGAYFQRIGVAVPLQVNTPDGPTFGVVPIDAPANPALAPTPMANLVKLHRPGEVTYGTEVTLRTGTTPQTAYVFGYDEVGRVRVLWNDGETMELLDPQERIQVVHTGDGIFFERIDAVDDMEEDRSQDEMPSHGSLAAFGWTRVEYTAEQLAMASSVLAPYVANLAGLVDRPVAEHPTLTIRDYIGLITKDGYGCYIVGGAVRDVLLGANPNDIDLASTMPAPDTYEAIVTDPRGLGKKSGRGGQLSVRKNFPFGTVQVEPTKVTGLDIICTHSLPHGSSLSIDVDAFARDFTVNAVYYDPSTNKIVDPTGQGLPDLIHRRITFILKPAEVLKRDLVLIGRWIKFVVKGYQPDPAHLPLIIAALARHVDSADDAVRTRFIDRSGLSPTGLVAAATKIDATLGQLIAKIVRR